MPGFISVLSSFLFLFRTAGPEILPSQTYDYDDLTSFALKSGCLKDWSATEQKEMGKDGESEHVDAPLT